MAQAQTRFDRLARRVPLDAPWTARQGRASGTRTTFESWIVRNARTEKARSLLRLYSEAVFAAEPGDFSLLHALFYTHSGGGVDALAGVKNGAQQDRYVGGSQLVPDRAGRGARRRGRAARARRSGAIEQRGDVVTVLADGLLVTARRVIVAVPPVLAGRIDYDPPLPGVPRPAHPAGARRVGDQVQRRLRRARSGGPRASPARRRATTVPVKVVFDNSPPSGTPGVLLAFLEGAHAAAAQPGLARASGAMQWCGASSSSSAARRRRSIEYVELDWSEEEWTRGCYGAHFPCGVWTQYGPALRAPIGRIHWAGTETATIWIGYMDGALQSGARAASEVIAAG